MKKRLKIDYKELENTTVKGVKILNCINPDEIHNDKKRLNAICLCGKERTVRLYDIFYRKKLRCKECGWKSCGQYKLNNEAGLNKVFLVYKSGAKKRDIHFELDKQTFKELTTKNCTYCGSEPRLMAFYNKPLDYHAQYTYNGIDRVNSDLGYTVDNCVTCCQTCNISKSIMTVEQFRNWITKIYNHYIINT